MAELMSFAYLSRSAITTAHTTRQTLRGACEHVPKAIDALLKLPYFVSKGATDPTGFGWWAHQTYASAGHTAGLLYKVWEEGFYLEATILLRHLLETLVQLKYFDERRDELVPHLTRRPEVNFKKMFNVCAPGFHRFWSLWAGAAHGGMEAGILRIGLGPKGEQSWRPGCEYDDARASIVINQFAATLLGFLNVFPRVFPESGAAEEGHEGVLAARADAIAWLGKAADAQLDQFPVSENWLLPLLKLAEYTPSRLREKK